MSKLDDIKLSGIVLSEHRDGAQAKQQIKDLMLELIAEQEQTLRMETSDKLTLINAHLLRQKVNEL